MDPEILLALSGTKKHTTKKDPERNRYGDSKKELRDGKRMERGRKVKNNKGTGMVEFILVLAILITVILVFREKLAEAMAWLYRSFFMGVR